MSNTDPKSFNLPEVNCLRPEQIDNLGRALINLTKEVCILNDRVMVLEELLADAGIDAVKALENHQPSDALQKKIDAQTMAITQEVVGPLMEG